MRRIGGLRRDQGVDVLQVVLTEVGLVLRTDVLECVDADSVLRQLEPKVASVVLRLKYLRTKAVILRAWGVSSPFQKKDWGNPKPTWSYMPPSRMALSVLSTMVRASLSPVRTWWRSRKVN